MKNHLHKLALDYGFVAVGVAQVRKLQEEEQHLTDWLNQGYHGEMGYMENHRDKRLHPGELVPGAKTVISFAYNYFPGSTQAPHSPAVARYAWGGDYHRVVKDVLYDLVAELETVAGPIQGRVFTDSAPVMERQWAALSGLGWIGKNSLLLRKGVGSWFFLAEIISDLDLEPDAPVTDHCGSCTACIDACPTQAIVQDGVVDARKCISYLTIEKKSPLTAGENEMLNGWAFGCDICQEVCPWNRFAEPHAQPRFEPAGDWLHWDHARWLQLTEAEFGELFGHTPLARAGYGKFMEAVIGNR
ncbi:MAG: tRNA epoxyqueuosine(34) reductase QueG [Bacteroidetes bacterium]|nr:tRNA epoxyqueuosine(34) reductase QueG [Bacteroidota bacterium]